MIKEYLLKVELKFKNILYQNIIPCFLTFCSSDQSQFFKFLIFNYSSMYIIVNSYFVYQIRTYVHTVL